MQLSNRDLELFLCVAEERSFTKAAARSNLSQSALSSRIKALEKGLGVALFDRTTRWVELTAEGRVFEASARRLHHEFTEMVRNFHDYAARRKGRVSIAALPSICAAWLPELFIKFQALYPGIVLSLADKVSEECLDLVRSGGAEIAITSTQGDDDELMATTIGQDTYYLICQPGHPLLTKPELTAEDLAQHPFVHVARDASVRQHLDAALHPVVLRHVLEVQYMGTIAGMVEAGLGISIIPALSHWQFRRDTLASRPVNIPNLARPIQILKRRGHVLSPAAQAFYEHVLRQRRSLELITSGANGG
jgi:LysR family transcriptional regulator, carnitine catabolism transcriptional activator